MAGATVQGVAGLGLGLIAAPVVTLAAPDLMPGTLLVLAALLPLLTLLGEREDVDWAGLGWSMPARVVGTAVGVWLVVVLADRWLVLAVGVMVLLSVVVTWRSVEVPVNRRTLVAAGAFSGVSGTTTSVGGPPMALLYQHRPPRQVRTTLAVYFVLGATLSLVGLLLAGQLTSVEVVAGVLGLPLLGIGAWLGARLRDRVDVRTFRAVVLVVCAASAAALLVTAARG